MRRWLLLCEIRRTSPTALSKVVERCTGVRAKLHSDRYELPAGAIRLAESLDEIVERPVPANDAAEGMP